MDHQRERVARLERAIDEAVDKVPASMRAVIDVLHTAIEGTTTRRILERPMRQGHGPNPRES